MKVHVEKKALDSWTIAEWRCKSVVWWETAKPQKYIKDGHGWDGWESLFVPWLPISYKNNLNNPSCLALRSWVENQEKLGSTGITTWPYV